MVTGGSLKRFIARQPIFNTDLDIFGYELLFRSSLDNFFDGSNQDVASSCVIANSFLLFDLQEITHGKKAFLNCTRNVLIRDYPTTFPRELAIIELLEDIPPDDEVLAACRTLKEMGYQLALDDYVDSPAHAPLLKYADIIKVDFLASSEQECRRLVETYAPRGIKFLAEKVETQEVYEQAVLMGYSYFQGYFFSKPVIVSRKDISTAKVHHLKILQQINAPDIDLNQLAQTIQLDISISYKLLKYINSVGFGLSCKVSSIEHALMLLGPREAKKWVSLIAMTGLGEDKPDALILSSLMRGKVCESLAPLVGMKERQSDLFLMGLFSLLDALMGRPMEEILEQLPIMDDIKTALLGSPGALQDLLQLVIALERGNWTTMDLLASDFRLPEENLGDLHLEALQWSQNMFDV